LINSFLFNVIQFIKASSVRTLGAFFLIINVRTCFKAGMPLKPYKSLTTAGSFLLNEEERAITSIFFRCNKGQCYY